MLNDWFVMELKIRNEQPGDEPGIWVVNTRAFNGEAEAKLVNALRRNRKVILSLVAESGGRIIGHILFSPVNLNNRIGAGLAPMAVLPEFQNQGAGSLLVSKGIEECKNLEFEFVVVLGHAHFYPRFGFQPSVKYGIKSEYDVPDDTFMILELRENSLLGIQGVVKYQPEFNEL